MASEVKPLPYIIRNLLDELQGQYQEIVQAENIPHAVSAWAGQMRMDLLSPQYGMPNKEPAPFAKYLLMKLDEIEREHFWDLDAMKAYRQALVHSAAYVQD